MIEIKWDIKQCGVYCIRNKISSKSYFGSSVNCYHRIKSQHLAKLRKGTHNNPHLQSSFRKYGEKAFEYFIVELCEEKYMLIQEQWHIDKSKCLDRRFGYNINTKTEKPILTEEQCEKIRLSKLGKKRSNKRSLAGVYKSGKNWMAKIGFHGREFYLGCFKRKQDAELVYTDALVRAQNNKGPDLSFLKDLKISHSKPVLQKNLKTREIIRHESARSASRTGFSLSCILDCCHGRYKAHKGFSWSFV